MIVMNNGSRIIKVTLTPTDNGYYEGTVLCHWGNIDPEEYVTWAVRGKAHPEEQYGPIRLDAGIGRYIIGREEALADFNQRQAGWANFSQPIYQETDHEYELRIRALEGQEL